MVHASVSRLKYLKKCLLCPILSVQENWDRTSKIFSTSSLMSSFIKNTVPLVCSTRIVSQFGNLHSPYSPIQQVLFEIRPFANAHLLVPCQFASNEKAAEVSKFFATRTKPAVERVLKQSLETVRINARWVEGIRSEPRLAQTVRELLAKP